MFKELSEERKKSCFPYLMTQKMHSYIRCLPHTISVVHIQEIVFSAFKHALFKEIYQYLTKCKENSESSLV